MGYPHESHARETALLSEHFGAKEATTLDGFRFRVLRADSRRLHTLQIERITPPTTVVPEA